MAERGVVLSLDEGTTGTTAVVVGVDGVVRGKGYREITQHYPRPGWVEHDANEIWSAVQQTARNALTDAGAQPHEVRAIGITNQRETLVLWDRRTLEPLAPAIVWQDRRTAAECDRLREAGHEARVRQITGLVLDPYFTATKLAWPLRTSMEQSIAQSERSTVGSSHGCQRDATTSRTPPMHHARSSLTSARAPRARRWQSCSACRQRTCRAWWIQAVRFR